MTSNFIVTDSETTSFASAIRNKLGMSPYSYMEWPYEYIDYLNQMPDYFPSELKTEFSQLIAGSCLQASDPGVTIVPTGKFHDEQGHYYRQLFNGRSRRLPFILWPNCSYIGSWAFYNPETSSWYPPINYLVSVSLPNVTRIESHAFDTCFGTGRYLSIPNCSYIGDYGFRNAGFSGGHYYGYGIQTFNCMSTRTIGQYAFTSLRLHYNNEMSIILLSKVHKLCSYAFYSMAGIQSTATAAIHSFIMPEISYIEQHALHAFSGEIFHFYIGNSKCSAEEYAFGTSADNSNFKIYVPSAYLNLYKWKWLYYASIIYGF